MVQINRMPGIYALRGFCYTCRKPGRMRQGRWEIRWILFTCSPSGRGAWKELDRISVHATPVRNPERTIDENK